MKYLAVALGLVVAVGLGLLGIIHWRRNVERQLTKTSYFENINHGVVSDVLKDLQNNIAEANTTLGQTRKQIVDLTANIKTTQEAVDGGKAELNTCNDELNQIKTEIGALEAERNQTETEFQKSKASLKEQIKNLKIEIQKRSKVCDYIIKNSVEGMKLCGIELVIQEEQKPVASKAA